MNYFILFVFWFNFVSSYSPFAFEATITLKKAQTNEEMYVFSAKEEEFLKLGGKWLYFSVCFIANTTFKYLFLTKSLVSTTP